MKAPDKIYIDKKDAEIPSDYYAFSMPPYVNHKYIEYIRKKAILEWAKDRLDKSVTQPVQLAMKSVIDKINSL